jgi:hypothetical protein
LVQIHPKLIEFSANSGLEVRLEAAFEIEMDEQWSYVGNKSNQRWLWHAVDHATNTVLAYVFGKRKDDVFKQLKTFQGFNVSHYTPPAIAKVISENLGLFFTQKTTHNKH